MAAEMKQNFKKAKDLSKMTPEELLLHFKYELATRDISIRQMCSDLGLNYNYMINLTNGNLPAKGMNFERLTMIADYLGYTLHFAMKKKPK